MRLRRAMIDRLAAALSELVEKGGLAETSLPRAALQEMIRQVITEDLLVEDRLNEEVREILRAHEAEMEKGNVNYTAMFQMVKRKLVQERGLVL